MAIALVSIVSTAAAMRPGGGSSFSGGSSSSRGSSSSGSSRSSGSWSSGSGYSGSSGSGSDDFGLIGLLISSGLGGFSFVGFVVFLIVVSLIMKRRGLALNWQAGVGDGQARRERIRPLLEQIRADDPNFSLVLLDDFLYALYAQARTLPSGGALERPSSYLKPPARAALASLGNVREVRAIIVGAMRYLSVDGVSSGPRVVRLTVEFESN